MRLLIGGTPTGTLKHISKQTYRHHCGMLTSWADGASPLHAVRIGAPWAMDNFAFVSFDADRFRKSLQRFESIPGCLFVVAPDVPRDAHATATLFDAWCDDIKRHGYPIALAAQDGLENMPINWKTLDAIFVGGSDAFKYSQFVQELVFEARMRHKWTHMGRVNSVPRWNYCQNALFDSVDGTGTVIERRRVKEALGVLLNPRVTTWKLRPNVEAERVKEA